MRENMKPAYYEVTLLIEADAELADVLPGWPGYVNPNDPTDYEPPVDGVQFAVERAVYGASRVLHETVERANPESRIFVRVSPVRRLAASAVDLDIG
jgi:hypothetical protein